MRLPNESDLKEAASRWPNLAKLEQWRGAAPAWSDLGCRGCWGVIEGGNAAVEAGVGAFHAACFDAVVAYIAAH